MNTTLQCPVCRSNERKSTYTAVHTHGKKTLSEEKSFIYFQCLNCSSLYLTNVTFNASYYKKYYSFEEGEQRLGLTKILEWLISSYSLKRKHEALRHYNGASKKKISILDIGCGTGDFLASLSDKRYRKYGIEKDKKEYMISRNKGVEVFNEDILHSNLQNKKFDIITMWHVIEHIPNPQKLFTQLHQMLSKDGVIIFATPNIDSHGFRAATTNWFHFDAPRHVILFNEEGIKKLCNTNGFTLKRVYSETFEFPLDLLWSLKKSRKNYPLVSLFFYPFLKLRAKETLTYIITKKK